MKDTKSETTKRIEEILKSQVEAYESGTVYPEKGYLISLYETAKVLTTHLHQEVIRGKIEEHKIDCDHCNISEQAGLNSYCDRLADLQRQIEE